MNENENKLNAQQLFMKWVSLLPVSVWMLLLIVAPLCYVLFMSFMTKGTYGGVVLRFTLKNFAQVFQMEYLKIYAQYIGLGVVTTLICLAIAYPFTLFLVQKTSITRTILMAFVIVPSVVNSLVRLFGWTLLLRKTGLINSCLLRLGLIAKPLDMMYSSKGIVIGMVYLLLMFMILPLYSSLEKVDPALLEAAGDLGARKVAVVKNVLIPLTKPGIFAGSIMVFIPSLGYFFVSDVMGGGTLLMMGNLIKNEFMEARNWPLGGAISIILIALTLFLLYLYEKRGGNMEDLGGR